MTASKAKESEEELWAAMRFLDRKAEEVGSMTEEVVPEQRRG